MASTVGNQKEQATGCYPSSNSNHVMSLFHQKLFNRNGEKEALLNVYQRMKKSSPKESAIQEELVLISGESGSDKAMLANTLRPVVEENGGCFLTGRFQEKCHSGPYSVFVSAFTEFVEILSTQLCEKKIQVLRKDVEEALGEEERVVLINMIPAMQKIVPTSSIKNNDSIAANLVQGGGGFSTSSSAAQNRFSFLFCRFCRAIFTTDRPLVLFLDDLQWATPASLQLIHALLTNCNPKSMLLIGSYKEEETMDRMTHLPKPFCKTLEKWEKRPSTEITRIQVTNVTSEEINEVLVDVFRLNPEKSGELADLIWEQTSGEHSSATLFLQLLFEQGLLYCQDGSMEWTWDSEKARSNRRLQTTISRRSLQNNCPVEVTRKLINSLPDFTQEVIKVAACLGEALDDLALAMVLDDSEKVSESLAEAERAGLLEFHPRVSGYRFRDGNSQQAAYSLIPEQQRGEFKLRIGRKLWHMLSTRALETNLFLVVNLLNEGMHIMDYQPEKYRLAELNLRAADKAVGLSLFVAADMYLTNGIRLLGTDHWKEKYNLSLELYQTATEVAVVNANFERVEELIKEVLEYARTLEDKIRSYLSLIVSLGQQDDLHEAERIGFSLLDELGEPFPQKASKFYIVTDLMRTRRMLRRMSDKRLLDLPEMTNESKMTSIHVLNVLLPYAYLSRSPFVPLIAFRMIRLSLKYGLFPGSSIAFATYGMILCGALGDAKKGYRFGQLALSFLERNQAHQAWLPRVYSVVYTLIIPWSLNVREIIEPMRHAIDVAMKIGDVEQGMSSAVVICFTSYYGGVSLDVLGREGEEVFDHLCDYRQENMILAIRPLLQAIRNLTGRAEDPQLLTGDMLDKDVVLKEAIETNNITVAVAVLRLAMEMAYIFGNYKLASELLVQIKKFQKAPSPSLYGDGYYTYRKALIGVAMMQECSTCTKTQMKFARGTLKKLIKWAKNSPSNFSHKEKLLKAELESLRGCHSSAMKEYHKAIQGATEEGFVQEAALSCERAARHLQRMNDEKLASSGYFSQAHTLYMKWGATAKADQIQGMTQRSDGNYETGE